MDVCFAFDSTPSTWGNRGVGPGGLSGCKRPQTPGHQGRQSEYSIRRRIEESILQAMYPLRTAHVPYFANMSLSHVLFLPRISLLLIGYRGQDCSRCRSRRFAGLLRAYRGADSANTIT